MVTKSVVIDLDGTLIPGNSFTLYVKYCLLHFPGVMTGICRIVLLRKLRTISHFDAKVRIMRLTAPLLNEMNLRPFLEKLKSMVRPEFREILSAGDTQTCLATAAPVEYADPLGRMLGFDVVCATEIGSGVECRGEEKLRRVREAGISFDSSLSVYSDHNDDLPLFQANSKGVNHLVR